MKLIGLSFLTGFFFFFHVGSFVFGQTVFDVDFHESMDISRNYKKGFVETNFHWKKIKELYDEYVIKNPKYSKIPRIPKIIHQIWLGSPFPEKYKELQATWKKHHPDWEYILWTDEDVDKFCLENKEIYDNTLNLGARSDIARYEILYRMGGLYVDTDFECLRSFDWLHHCLDFYTGVAYDKDVVLFNGLIASAPGHPILRKCIDDMRPRLKKNEGGVDVMDRTGPYFFSRCFLHVIDKYNGPTVVFPLTYFYPWPNFARKNGSYKEILKWVRPESHGIHHWHVSWLKK